MEKTTEWGALWPVLLTQYYWGDQVKNNENSKACGTYGGVERCIYDCGGGTWGKDPLGRPRHSWKDIFQIDLQEVVGRHGLDCSDSGQEQVEGSYECGNEPPGSIYWGGFLGLLGSQEGLCSMQLVIYVISVYIVYARWVAHAYRINLRHVAAFLPTAGHPLYAMLRHFCQIQAIHFTPCRGTSAKCRQSTLRHVAALLPTAGHSLYAMLRHFCQLQAIRFTPCCGTSANCRQSTLRHVAACLPTAGHPLYAQKCEKTLRYLRFGPQCR